MDTSRSNRNQIHQTSIARFYRSVWENNARATTLTSTTCPSDSCIRVIVGPETPITDPFHMGIDQGALLELMGVTQIECDNILESVYKYHGFYIGRYEAG